MAVPTSAGAAPAGRHLPMSVRNIKTQAVIIASMLGVLWAGAGADFLLAGRLAQYGIVPRTELGLRGVVFAPFLHAGFAHLLANSAPFAVLGWCVMLRRTSDILWVTLCAMLVGGMGTWLLGASGTLHIGASGVVFGYLGFLVARGYFERSVGAILVSAAVALAYGGMLWGVLPGQAGISWEGHLFGCLGGMLAARLLARRAAPAAD